jgi:predicted aspartyl protease
MDLDDEPVMKLMSSGPLLEVQVNGHSTCALVDTGAKETCIRPELAQKLGLRELKRPSYDPQRGTLLDRYEATLLVGGIPFQDHEIRGFVIVEREPFSVIVGRDILAFFVLEYDGPNGTFALRFPE